MLFLFSNEKVFKPPFVSEGMDLGRKITGGKYHSRRKKRLHERRHAGRVVILGSLRRKQLRVRSGFLKTILLKADTANVRVGNRTQTAQITNVESTPQNPFLARQNRLLKGAIIETSLGKARITNRPTREGCVNAVLIEQK